MYSHAMNDVIHSITVCHAFKINTSFVNIKLHYFPERLRCHYLNQLPVHHIEAQTTLAPNQGFHQVDPLMGCSKL